MIGIQSSHNVQVYNNIYQYIHVQVYKYTMSTKYTALEIDLTGSTQQPVSIEMVI